MSWTPERTELLRKLWQEGLSASLIAARIGGFRHCVDRGRSAVIGKAHRLGLAHRKTLTRTPTRKSKRRRVPLRKPTAFGAFGRRPPWLEVAAQQFAAEPLPPPSETDIARLSFLDLGDGQCRWIPASVDPKHIKPHEPQFCGEKTVPGTSWCLSHLRRAYALPDMATRSLRPALSVVADRTRELVE